MKDLAISAQELNKTFKTPKGTITAVDHLSLQVAPGETYGLIGPDGAGKTTAIRALAGLIGLDGGEARVLGLDPLRGGGGLPRHRPVPGSVTCTGMPARSFPPGFATRTSTG